MEEFGSTNNSLSALILSVYLIGNCFGPLVIAPLSELYGRSIMYNVCNVLFLVFVIGCALAPNLSSFIVFRLMSGLFGACPLTVGAGSIADVMLPEKRGSAMSFWFLGPLLGPAIAPIGNAPNAHFRSM
jgi:MFS family permease